MKKDYLVKIEESKKWNLIFLLAFCFIGGILSIIVGTENTPWDFANYHYYNVHAFFNERIGYDIMPAGIQSYINPLVDVPYYLLIKYLNNYPKLIAFIQGTLYGFYSIFLLKIILILNKKTSKTNVLFIVFAFLIGATGIVMSVNLGTTYYDMLVTTFVLVSLYIILKHLKNKDSNINKLKIFIAGLFSGLAIAIKFPWIVFAISIIITILLLKKNIANPFKIILFYTLGILIAYLLWNGFWLINIYNHFQNPFFPYLNNIFQSPLAFEETFRHNWLFPKDTLRAFFYPLYWNSKQFSYFLFEMNDYRYPILFISVLFLILIQISTRKLNSITLNKFTKYVDYNSLVFIIIFTCVSYILWLNSFCIIRYLMPLEALSGILICSLLFIIALKFKIKNLIAYLYIGLFLFLLVTTNSNFRFRHPYGEKLISVEKLDIDNNSVVLMSYSEMPATIVIPFQNQKAKYINLLCGNLIRTETHTAYANQKIQEIIKDKKKYLIITGDLKTHDLNKLNEFIDVSSLNCRKLKNNISDNCYFCE